LNWRRVRKVRRVWEIDQEVKDREDTWVWKEEDEGKFTVSFAYNILQNTMLANNTNLFNTFWDVKASQATQYLV